MPGMDGLEFLKNARELSNKWLGMIFTAYMDVGSVMQAVGQDYVWRYIVKPWKDNRELVLAVRNALQLQEEKLARRHAEEQAAKNERLAGLGRLIAGMAVSMIPLLVLSIGSFYYLQKALHGLDEVMEEAFEEAIPIMRVESLISRSYMPANDYLIHGNSDEEVLFSKLAAEVEATFQEVLTDKLDVPDEKKTILLGTTFLLFGLSASLLSLYRCADESYFSGDSRPVERLKCGNRFPLAPIREGAAQTPGRRPPPGPPRGRSRPRRRWRRRWSCPGSGRRCALGWETDGGFVLGSDVTIKGKTLKGFLARDSFLPRNLRLNIIRTLKAVTKTKFCPSSKSSLVRH